MVCVAHTATCCAEFVLGYSEDEDNVICVVHTATGRASSALSSHGDWLGIEEDMDVDEAADDCSNDSGRCSDGDGGSEDGAGSCSDMDDDREDGWNPGGTPPGLPHSHPERRTDGSQAGTTQSVVMTYSLPSCVLSTKNNSNSNNKGNNNRSSSSSHSNSSETTTTNITTTDTSPTVLERPSASFQRHSGQDSTRSSGDDDDDNDDVDNLGEILVRTGTVRQTAKDGSISGNSQAAARTARSNRAIQRIGVIAEEPEEGSWGRGGPVGADLPVPRDVEVDRRDVRISDFGCARKKGFRGQTDPQLVNIDVAENGLVDPQLVNIDVAENGLVDTQRIDVDVSDGSLVDTQRVHVGVVESSLVDTQRVDVDVTDGSLVDTQRVHVDVVEGNLVDAYRVSADVIESNLVGTQRASVDVKNSLVDTGIEGGRAVAGSKGDDPSGAHNGSSSAAGETAGGGADGRRRGGESARGDASANDVFGRLQNRPAQSPSGISARPMLTRCRSRRLEKKERADVVISVTDPASDVIEMRDNFCVTDNDETNGADVSENHCGDVSEMGRTQSDIKEAPHSGGSDVMNVPRPDRRRAMKRPFIATIDVDAIISILAQCDLC